jgi:hypothetical protein
MIEARTARDQESPGSNTRARFEEFVRWTI